MLATLIPFFDKDMKVCAYSLFSQKHNTLLEPNYVGSGMNDGAATVDGLDIIRSIGIDTLSPGTDVFVPVGHIALFSDIEPQEGSNRGRITLLFDQSIANDPTYLERLSALKKSGYKLAIRKLPVSEFQQNSELLSLMDYILLDHKKVDVTKAKVYFGYLHPNIRICVGNISSQDEYDALKVDPSFVLFEGSFYRLPITQGETSISPLKTTYLELLNTVNDIDFELTEAADIIGRDPAMVISLLDIVNRMSYNSKITSIRHAAAMLGQKELKKWINTAVTKELCTDRPSEITRLSLLRAKFMEQLAPMFGLSMKTSELFLTGLFSVLDLILNLPMAEALKKVNVSKDIADALINGTGDLYPAYRILLLYEDADWQEISRQMIIMKQKNDVIYDAYITSVKWYKDVFFS